MAKHHFGYLEAGDPNFCVHCGEQPGHEDHFFRGGEWEKVIADLQSKLERRTKALELLRDTEHFEFDAGGGQRGLRILADEAREIAREALSDE